MRCTTLPRKSCRDADAKFVTQRLTSQGVFDVNPALGGDDLNVARYFNDSLDDVFRQSSITATGRFGGFEFTYAGSYFDRNITYTHDYSMYSDYSSFIAPYYTCQNNGAGVLSACGDPREEFIGTNYIRRWDNEMRVQTPLNYPVHAIVGVFNETIEHRYTENYDIPGLNAQSILDSNPYTYLLFDGNRLDRQTAAFSEVTWDVTSKLSLLGGVRWFDETNTINGLFQAKPGGSLFQLTPHVTATEVGAIKKFNASYKIQPGVMVYGTYSEGYRPNLSVRLSAQLRNWNQVAVAR